jgi:hypothetical protein
MQKNLGDFFASARKSKDAEGGLSQKSAQSSSKEMINRRFREENIR